MMPRNPGTPVPDLPGIGDPIALRDPAGFYYASRVEGIDDDAITVARPADLKAGIVYDSGLALDLVWTQATGVHVLPTELAATSVERQVRLWHLDVVGDSYTEQRRDYVRVPVSGPIRVAVAPRLAGEAESPSVEDGASEGLPADGIAVDGTLVDVSEVATQCVLPVGLDDAFFTVGRRVRCQFGLGSADFDVAGRIVIRRPSDGIRQSRAVVRFDDGSAADSIRREVFRIQVELRRERNR